LITSEMGTMKATRSRFVARLAGLLLLAIVAATMPSPIRAASPPPPAGISSLNGTPLFAENVSWHAFSRYWTSFVRNADRVLLVVGLIAAAALFSITRGKWL
jgi:hypothetical protein